jgi:hypothetical protein
MIDRTSNAKIGRQPSTPHPLSRASWNIQSAVAMGLLAFVVSACDTEQRSTTVRVSPVPVSPVAVSPVTVSPIPASPVAISPIAVSPSPTTASPAPTTSPLTDLVGQDVTVSTKVQRVIAPNLFTVYDIESLRGQTVLVATKDQAPAVGTNIELDGVVRNFEAADIEREYGTELTADVEREFVNQPYVAATAIGNVD